MICREAADVAAEKAAARAKAVAAAELLRPDVSRVATGAGIEVSTEEALELAMELLRAAHSTGGEAAAVSEGAMLAMLRQRDADKKSGRPIFALGGGAPDVDSGGAVGPVRHAVAGHPDAGWAVDFYNDAAPQVVDSAIHIQGDTRVYYYDLSRRALP